jgi:hypothetical protein
MMTPLALAFDAGSTFVAGFATVSSTRAQVNLISKISPEGTVIWQKDFKSDGKLLLSFINIAIGQGSLYLLQYSNSFYQAQVSDSNSSFVSGDILSKIDGRTGDVLWSIECILQSASTSGFLQSHIFSEILFLIDPFSYIGFLVIRGEYYDFIQGYIAVSQRINVTSGATVWETLTESTSTLTPKRYQTVEYSGHEYSFFPAPDRTVYGTSDSFHAGYIIRKDICADGIYLSPTSSTTSTATECPFPTWSLSLGADSSDQTACPLIYGRARRAGVVVVMCLFFILSSLHSYYHNLSVFVGIGVFVSSCTVASDVAYLASVVFNGITLFALSILFLCLPILHFTYLLRKQTRGLRVRQLFPALLPNPLMCIPWAIVHIPLYISSFLYVYWLYLAGLFAQPTVKETIIPVFLSDIDAKGDLETRSRGDTIDDDILQRARNVDPNWEAITSLLVILLIEVGPQLALQSHNDNQLDHFGGVGILSLITKGLFLLYIVTRVSLLYGPSFLWMLWQSIRSGAEYAGSVFSVIRFEDLDEEVKEESAAEQTMTEKDELARLRERVKELELKANQGSQM